MSKIGDICLSEGRVEDNVVRGRFCSDAHQWRELCRLALAQAFRYVCHHIAPDAGGRNRCRLFRCHTLYSEEKLKRVLWALYSINKD